MNRTMKCIVDSMSDVAVTYKLKLLARSGIPEGGDCFAI